MLPFSPPPEAMVRSIDLLAASVGGMALVFIGAMLYGTDLRAALRGAAPIYLGEFGLSWANVRHPADAAAWRGARVAHAPGLEISRTGARPAACSPRWLL